jgi:hypothetical protein
MQYVHMRVGRDARDKAIDPRFLISKNEKGVAQVGARQARHAL